MKIMIVDSHAYLLESLYRFFLRSGIASSCLLLQSEKDVIPMLKGNWGDTDIIILDHSNGFTRASETYLISYIQRYFPLTRILIYSLFRLGSHIYKMYSQAVQGYIFKEGDDSYAELLVAMSYLMQGKFHYRGEVKATLEEYLKISALLRQSPSKRLLIV